MKEDYNCKKCKGRGFYQYTTTGTPHMKPCEDCCEHEGEPFADPNGTANTYCRAGCGKQMNV